MIGSSFLQTVRDRKQFTRLAAALTNSPALSLIYCASSSSYVKQHASVYCQIPTFLAASGLQTVVTG